MLAFADEFHVLVGLSCGQNISEAAEKRGYSAAQCFVVAEFLASAPTQNLERDLGGKYFFVEFKRNRGVVLSYFQNRCAHRFQRLYLCAAAVAAPYFYLAGGTGRERQGAYWRHDAYGQRLEAGLFYQIVDMGLGSYLAVDALWHRRHT